MSGPPPPAVTDAAAAAAPPLPSPSMYLTFVRQRTRWLAEAESRAPSPPAAAAAAAPAAAGRPAPAAEVPPPAPPAAAAPLAADPSPPADTVAACGLLYALNIFKREHPAAYRALINNQPSEELDALNDAVAESLPLFEAAASTNLDAVRNSFALLGRGMDSGDECRGGEDNGYDEELPTQASEHVSFASEHARRSLTALGHITVLLRSKGVCDKCNKVRGWWEGAGRGGRQRSLQKEGYVIAT